MHGHELVEQLYKTSEITDYDKSKIEGIWNMFQDMSDELVNQTDVTPDQTLAIRATKDAAQAWVDAILNNR